MAHVDAATAVLLSLTCKAASKAYHRTLPHASPSKLMRGVSLYKCPVEWCRLNYSVAPHPQNVNKFLLTSSDHHIEICRAIATDGDTITIEELQQRMKKYVFTSFMI